MSDKCVFVTDEGTCSILISTRCTGFRSKRVCSFSKTNQEYINAINDSIRLNRKKGNCFNCKYRSVQCEIREMEDEYDG